MQVSLSVKRYYPCDRCLISCAKLFSVQSSWRRCLTIWGKGGGGRRGGRGREGAEWDRGGGRGGDDGGSAEEIHYSHHSAGRSC